MTILRCKDCGHKFSWSFAEKGKWPDYCENPDCATFIGTDKGDDVICMPALKGARTKSIDKVYRDMEAGSETRMHLAAEAAGVPASEMAGLKITDLNDRRDTEVAAKEDKVAVANLTAGRSNSSLDFFKQNGAEFSAGIGTGNVTVDGKTTTGIYPRAGANTLQRIQRLNGRG